MKNNIETLVAIDAANLHYALIGRGWRIDWEKFQRFCVEKFGQSQFFYYEGTPTQTQFFHNNKTASLADFKAAKEKKKKYFLFLRNVGYQVRTKPIHSVYDTTEGRYRHKCNFDVELTIDALDWLPHIKKLVLCSGDGDFVRLIKYYKRMYRKVVVIADGKHFNWELEKSANQVFYIEDLRQELQRENSPTE